MHEKLMGSKSNMSERGQYEHNRSYRLFTRIPHVDINKAFFIFTILLSLTLSLLLHRIVILLNEKDEGLSGRYSVCGIQLLAHTSLSVV